MEDLFLKCMIEVLNLIGTGRYLWEDFYTMDLCFLIEP